jgi:hypothetical protein
MAFVALCLFVVSACDNGPAVDHGVLRITTETLPNARRSRTYETHLVAAGGTQFGYTWELEGGVLPPGLTLDAMNPHPTWGEFETVGEVDLDAVVDRGLREISGIAASRLNPGIIWAHDDSGAEPVFYALNEDGSVQQTYRLDIVARDWEDMFLGPGPDPTKEYLHIADIGDNGQQRGDYRIVRVEEPIVPEKRGETIDVAHEAFFYLYPGTAFRNGETAFIDWESGVVYVWEKDGTDGDIYRFPGPLDPAFTFENPAILEAVTTGGSAPDTLTAGDASRDAQRVVVRGYNLTFWEYIRPTGGEFVDMFSRPPRLGSIVNGPQHEAICFSPDGASLYTVSEKGRIDYVPIDRAHAEAGALDTLVKGMPVQVGVYYFSIRVTDSDDNTVVKDFVLTVAP